MRLHGQRWLKKCRTLSFLAFLESSCQRHGQPWPAPLQGPPVQGRTHRPDTHPEEEALRESQHEPRESPAGSKTARRHTLRIGSQPPREDTLRGLRHRARAPAALRILEPCRPPAFQSVNSRPYGDEAHLDEFGFQRGGALGLATDPCWAGASLLLRSALYRSAS